MQECKNEEDKNKGKLNYYNPVEPLQEGSLFLSFHIQILL